MTSFFQVLVEILKVEISLLLNDALSIMHASSTSTAEPSQEAVAEPRIQASPLQPRAQTAPAAQPHIHHPSTAPAASDSANTEGPAQSNTDHSKLPANSTATPSSNRPDAPTQNSNASPVNIRSGPKGGSSSSKCNSSEHLPESLYPQKAGPSTEQQSGGSTSLLAEARVTDVLPAVFSLMEGCLQALAADAQAGEDQQEGSRLDDQVAQRAMQALSEAFETVLQFLELVRTEGLDQDSPWLLAAVRAVGRQVALPLCMLACSHIEEQGLYATTSILHLVCQLPFACGRLTS